MKSVYIREHAFDYITVVLDFSSIVHSEMTFSKGENLGLCHFQGHNTVLFSQHLNMLGNVAIRYPE